MTTTARAEMGAATDTIGTVVLGFGPQPMDWISKASKVCGRDAVMDAETPSWRTPDRSAAAPKTYALIKAAITEPAF